MQFIASSKFKDWALEFLIDRITKLRCLLYLIKVLKYIWIKFSFKYIRCLLSSGPIVPGAHDILPSLPPYRYASDGYHRGISNLSSLVAVMLAFSNMFETAYCKYLLQEEVNY